jgi:hypothetical protein
MTTATGRDAIVLDTPDQDKFGSLTNKQVKDYIKKHGTNVFTTLLNEPQRTQVSFATGLYNIINN